MSAADLAREIIDQSKPADRPSQMCIDVRKYNYSRSTVLKITAPVIDGRLVIEIRRCGEQIGPIRYNAKTNFDIAVAFVEAFASVSTSTQASVKSLADDGNESVEWFSWPLSTKPLKQIGDDHTMTKRIEFILSLLIAD